MTIIAASILLLIGWVLVLTEWSISMGAACHGAAAIIALFDVLRARWR